MSLINNMLKNIERRELNKRSMHNVTFLYAKRDNALFFNKKIGLIFAVLGLIMFSSYFYFTNAPQPKLAKMLAYQKQSSPLDPESANQRWLNKATITGVTLQLKDNITEVIFSLDHPILYRIINSNMQNEISLIVEGAELQSQFPVLNTLNTALQGVDYKLTQDGARFNFVLFPGAMIKYLNLNDEKGQFELVIGFEHHFIADSSNPTNKQIKSPIAQNLLDQKYQLALSVIHSDKKFAIKLLHSLLDSDPDYQEARVSLVAILIEENKNVLAEKVITEGLSLNAHYVPFIELKARILAKNGKIKQALSMLQNNSPSIDENPEYHAFMASLYAQSNNDKMAMELYKRLLEINPENGSWWFGLAVAYDRLNYPKQAVRAYMTAAEKGHLDTELMSYMQNRLQLLQRREYERG